MNVWCERAMRQYHTLKRRVHDGTDNHATNRRRSVTAIFIVSAAAAAAGLVMVYHVNLIDYSLLVMRQSSSFTNVQ